MISFFLHTYSSNAFLNSELLNVDLESELHTSLEVDDAFFLYTSCKVVFFYSPIVDDFLVQNLYV